MTVLLKFSMTEKQIAITVIIAILQRQLYKIQKMRYNDKKTGAERLQNQHPKENCLSKSCFVIASNS